VDDPADATLVEQGVDGLCRRVLAVRDPTGAGILEQELDGLRRVLLVRADDPRRTTLDPTCAVHARQGLTVVTEDAPAVVADRAARLVERNLGDCDAVVADAAKDEPARNRLALVRRHGDDAAVALLETVAHDLDRFDALLAEDGNRRD